MESRKGFTLLEVLIVVALFVVLFAAIEFMFTGTLFSALEISGKVDKETSALSLYSQMNRQLFSRFNPKKENFLLTENRLSFYTLSPVFFEGGVRAEYLFNGTERGVRVIYEEFPCPDGRLGTKGKKKMDFGVFDNVSFSVFQNGEWKREFGEDFPGIGNLTVDGRSFIVVGSGK